MNLNININIILILLLLLCLLNMKNINLSNIIGGSLSLNKELSLHKNLETDISKLKDRLKEIDSEININKLLLNKQKDAMFTSSTRTKLFETQIIIKNLINEKETIINMLEKALVKYNTILEGGKNTDFLDNIKKIEKSKLRNLELTKNEPVINNNLLSKSQLITKNFGNIITNNNASIADLNSTQESDILSNDNLIETTSDDENIENNYDVSIVDEEDLNNGYASNIMQNMELNNYRDYTNNLIEANTNNL